MLKRNLFTAVALVGAISLASAEEAATASLPKVGIEFSQTLNTEYVNGRNTAASDSSFDGAAQYSKSELKAKATFDAFGLSITPSVKGSLEIRPKYNSDDTQNELKGRNRETLALDIGKSFSSALNLGAGLAYRLQSDRWIAYTDDFFPSQRVSPSLTVSGTVSNFDYSFTNILNFYLDSTVGRYDNGTDDLFTEYNGYASVGKNVKLGETVSVYLNLDDDFYLDFASADAATGSDSTEVYSYLTATGTLAFGDFKPSAGVLWTYYSDPTGDASNNLLGGVFSLGFKAGAWNFTGKYEAGFNTEIDNQVEARLSLSAKINA